MSYTARPPFTGGMSNQNQQQQQSGQPNNANIGASGIPNMPIMNNAASIPGNHLPNPSGSSAMSVLDQKVFQQQLILQRQLLQSQQYQQQQLSQQNQQAKFQQQQPNQTQAFNRLMSDMLNANEKNGSNVAQQSSHLQQIVQLQALSNMMQLQQAAQQKSFQQQSVPLPTNTTITPVARQNMSHMQKPPVNYPRPNVQNKNTTSNVGSSPMQSRKSFPNAPKSTTMPQMQSAAPLNIPSGSSKSSTLPQMPSAMTSATSSPKGYADIFAASLSNSQASMNITPSLTITKTNSPSGTSPSSVKSNSNPMANKSISSMASSQKSFLSEAISMSLGNVPFPVKATQPPSVSVTPTNKPTYSPTNKQIPVTPQKLNLPPNVPGLQKLSPTSPRTKQTPRKNTNPIRTTTTSLPAATVQSSPPLVVPQIVTKVTNPSPKPPPPAPVSPAVAKAATVTSPSSVRSVPATPPKTSVAAISAAPVTQATTKPVQAVANSNSTAINTAKVNAPIPKVETPTKPSESTPKAIKPEEKKNTEVKAKEPEKTVADTVEKITEAVKSEKSDSSGSSVQPTAPVAESKTKQTTSQNASAVTNKTQSTPLDKNEKKKKEPAVSNVSKSSTDQTIKTPLTKAARLANAAVLTPNSADAKVKRNRFKTIPYQSPTPEIELVSKISANEAINAHKKKVDEDKLTLFYKNEFLAVRNADGGFFLCQTMNNIYKSSPKIRIRWLSEDAANKNIYSLDFYDSTDIECVLTSVSLNRVGKGKFELKTAESERIKNILKKALDVEKGILNRLDVTEENPDGLDLSLYKDESQIEKKTSGKRKARDKADGGNVTPAAKKPKATVTKNRETTSARASKSNVDESKVSNTATKSAKKSPAKKTPSASKKGKGVKNSDNEEGKSTPITKRAATKRKLAEETSDPLATEPDAKRVKTTETSKDGDAGKDVSKPEEKSPKQSSEKQSESAKASTTETAEPTAGRPTRRSK